MPADWGYDIGKWKENTRVGHRVGDKGLERRAQGREQSGRVQNKVQETGELTRRKGDSGHKGWARELDRKEMHRNG